jgi:CrcB protein
MLKLLIIGGGGFLGAVARYVLTGFAQRVFDTLFPIGTLVVNVLGCLCIGVMIYLVEDRMVLSSDMRLFLAIGLLGAFTTFSTFGYETIQMLRDGQSLEALVNVLLNVTLGIGAVWFGRLALKVINL